MFNITLIGTDSPVSESHAQLLDNAQNLSWIIEHKILRFQTKDELSIEQIQTLRAQLDGDKIDVFCTPANATPKKLFLADMDSTIVTSETLDELADEAGIKDQIAAITTRAMRGELDFEEALTERVGLLEGLPEDALKRTLDSTEISTGGEQLLNGLKAQNIYCVLVSGGFTYFTGAIATELGFDSHHGNTLYIENGALTGTVGTPILDKESKLTYLKQYCAEQGIDITGTITIGDGANDLPMLEAAGLGIGYKPKPLVEERILNCIRYTDLSSVLYII